jgi:hypothetical protein
VLGRLSTYERWGVGLPHEIAIDDLCETPMEDWTDEQWQRAEASGFLSYLGPAEWCEAARNDEADGTDGMCRVRRLYLYYFPASALADQEDREQAGGSPHECSYQEDDDGLWTTDFPPPDGFDGDERGEPGLPGYRRSLTDAEQRAIDLEIERQDEEERERLAAAVSLQAADRDAFLADVAKCAAAGPAAQQHRRAAPPDSAA